MLKSRTHFEQIPLDVVKKIAGGDLDKDDKAGPHLVIVEPALRRSEPDRAPARSRVRKGR